VIDTIAELENYSEEEIESTRASINLKGILEAQLIESGKSPGMTQTEWEKANKNRRRGVCPTCSGEGYVGEKLRTVGTIHASSNSACIAALYYDVTGEIRKATEISIALQLTFAIGHAIHAQIQDAFHTALEEDYKSEVPVDLPEAMICNGSADGVIALSLCSVLLEIKTISPDEFGKLRKAKPEHLIQASLYAKGLDVPFISFLYVSKGWPHDIKEYVQVYDEDVFHTWYRGKGSKVEEALENGKPPVANASSYECKNCGYRKDCPQAVGINDRFRRK
jgi:CRISPR/Cas system-associated exonuclease Cas4 (RecB family)